MAICIPYLVIDMVKTGANIKRFREGFRLKGTEVQAFLGLASPQAVYQWERGISSLPTADHLCALSHLFGVPMNEILILKGAANNDGAENARRSPNDSSIKRREGDSVVRCYHCRLLCAFMTQDL